MKTYKGRYTAKSFIALVMLTSLPCFTDAQVKLRRIPGTVPKIVCYADEGYSDRHIPPPEVYRSALKSGTEPGAEIEMILVNAPDTLAYAAAEEVAGIWASLIHSPVPIRIEVTFEQLESGVLGSTGPDGAYYVDENGYLPRRVYFTALAEKLFGTNVNGDLPDMYVSMNTGINWHYDPQSEPGAKYDFTSVLLHEVAHGLGFFGYFRVNEDQLGQGSETPTVFDHFLENAKGEKITDTTLFPLNSVQLGFQLQKPPIYFMSPLAFRELYETVELFVPGAWDQGSSLYHLAEVYDTLNSGRDALMTFSTKRGEAIHDPGPVTTMMFYDMGWLHTYIRHDSLMDRETLADPFTVTAQMYGDTTIADSTQYLFYSFNDDPDFDSLAMAPTGKSDEYAADIPVPGTGTFVNYYLRVEDSLGRVYTLPPEAPGNSFRFYVGTDTIFPTIEHRPLNYILISNDSVEVVAKIRDNLGIDTALAEYNINGAGMEAFGLFHDTLNDFKGYFIFSPGELSVGDVINYRIKAVDGSQASNTTCHPEDGYHSFVVEDIPRPQDEYQNDFETDSTDFLISDAFSRQKPDGFSSYALHSDHPYPEPAEANTFWNFTAQLKFPIRLSAINPIMTFDEVAYIEPGLLGTDWGDENFFDFVIVEGSRDGILWEELSEGYDCRAYPEWESAFNAGPFEGNTSQAEPTEDDMKTRLVNLVEETPFNAGDTILIRFRLHSDPYAVGWGWMIDNLKIQGTTLIPEYPLMKETISVYPNPSSGRVQVNLQMKESVAVLEIRLMDLLGREIFRESHPAPGHEFTRSYQLDYLPDGLYLIQFRAGSQKVMKKILLAR